MYDAPQSPFNFAAVNHDTDLFHAASAANLYYHTLGPETTANSSTFS